MTCFTYLVPIINTINVLPKKLKQTYHFQIHFVTFPKK
jgi:hypothetical protein